MLVLQLPLPSQDAAMELLRGTMVRHNLIAYRGDRIGGTASMSFVDERCQSYIPIPLPWTARIRERLPVGAAAVLINRAHPFPDLVMPIDSFEDRLYGTIDGIRTIGDMLSSVGVSRADHGRALHFFERTWHCDKVAMDASHS
jgi:hypothetical protein